MKIIINKSYGGFSISEKGQKYLGISTSYPTNKDFGITSDNEYAWRNDPRLISMLKVLGLEASNGKFAKLSIVDIPDDVDWTIDEYDGMEWVAEVHRTWE